jgi:peptidylprolyl isomerase
MPDYGQTAVVHYTGTLDDGTVFDSTNGNEPLTYEVGSGMLIHGFDEAVRLMSEGQQLSVRITAADAFGTYSKDRVEDIPLYSLLSAVQTPEVGKTYYIVPKDRHGAAYPIKILAIENGIATVDYNHPLAGKDLNFMIELLDIS